MPEPQSAPRIFSLDYRPTNDVSSMVALFSAMAGVRRPPRTAEKAAWLEVQGLAPEAAFPKQTADSNQA